MQAKQQSPVNRLDGLTSEDLRRRLVELDQERSAIVVLLRAVHAREKRGRKQKEVRHA